MTARVGTRRPFLIAIESHNRLSLDMETSSVNLARDNGGALKRRLLDGHTTIHSFNSHGGQVARLAAGQGDPSQTADRFRFSGRVERETHLASIRD